MAFFIPLAWLNYLEFLCGGGMFKKTYVEILMKVRRRAPGGRREDESEVSRESQHPFPHMLAPSLVACTISAVLPLPLSSPQLCQIMTFPIFPLVRWSLVPPLPLCLPSSFIFNTAVSWHLALPLPLALDISLVSSILYFSFQVIFSVLGTLKKKNVKTGYLLFVQHIKLVNISGNTNVARYV